MKRLQKMIRPFVLRRLKKEVLTDLPDKLEENMFVQLTGEQQKLYDAHVKRMMLMLDKQSEEEFKTSKITILAELTNCARSVVIRLLFLQIIKLILQKWICA